ncbi:hypothetical protein BDZ91DRAFT_791725 [Kalaharituber pfeilii]|nr:hypothetical protein BDZ91DRAFT_791725 [Kalaharituber pfeilii]
MATPSHPPIARWTASTVASAVALAAATAPFDCYSTAHTGDRNFPAPELQNRFLSDRSQESQQRGMQLLDALALLCISESRSQVIAVGAQIYHKPGGELAQVELTVTGNERTTSLDAISPFLQKLWRKMQTISRLTNQERRGVEPGSVLVKLSPTPPHSEYKVNARKIDDIILDMQVMAMSHTLSKYYRHFRKRYHKFLEFRIAFLGMPKNIWPGKLIEPASMLRNISTLILDLAEVFSEISVIKAHPSNAAVPRELYIKLVRLVATIGSAYNGHVESEIALCAGFVESHGGPNFPLERYIRKLCSCQYAISALVRWAESPRLRPTLKGPLKITLHASQMQEIPRLPSSVADWINLSSDIMQTASFIEKEGFREGIGAKAHQRYNTDSTPPFSYLGVSKLSCAACSLLIQSYNVARKTNFAVKGTHGKFYYPWGVPAVSKSILKSFRQLVCECLCKRWEQQGGGRMWHVLSDSTVDSKPEFIDSGSLSLSEDQIDRPPRVDLPPPPESAIKGYISKSLSQ